MLLLQSMYIFFWADMQTKIYEIAHMLHEKCALNILHDHDNGQFQSENQCKFIICNKKVYKWRNHTKCAFYPIFALI